MKRSTLTSRPDFRKYSKMRFSSWCYYPQHIICALVYKQWRSQEPPTKVRSWPKTSLHYSCTCAPSCSRPFSAPYSLAVVSISLPSCPSAFPKVPPLLFASFLHTRSLIGRPAFVVSRQRIESTCTRPFSLLAPTRITKSEEPIRSSALSRMKISCWLRPGKLFFFPQGAKRTSVSLHFSYAYMPAVSFAITPAKVKRSSKTTMLSIVPGPPTI